MTLSQIKRNLYILFWKYPELKNKNYNYLYFKYCLEFHEKEFLKINSYLVKSTICDLWEKMPAMESISRCKRKLAQNDELFRATDKKIINHKLKQTKEIVEAVKD
tara:strand:+ start:241 stop:555 length:315 start_codon:yes stop_codon:yes gene_type:complete